MRAMRATPARAVEPRWSVRARASEDARDARARGPTVNARGSAMRLDNVPASRSFRLGLFADAQFADRDDETRDDDSGRVKRFRASVERLAVCMRAFEREAATLSGVVNLGDLFDGYNEDDKTTRPVLRNREMSAETVDRNRRELSIISDVVKGTKLSCPFHHCVGNHDCSVPREEFLDAVNAQRAYYRGEDALYYYSEPLPRNWRLIILDTTDLNPRYIDARVAPEYYNPALQYAVEAYGSGRDDVAPWSGGIGPIQFAWLENELASAAKNGERIIIASHNALNSKAARPQMSAWNADSVSKLIEDSGCVKLCLAGHDHPGMYCFHHGVHYVTLEAMLEAKHGETSYAFLDVYEHEAILTGVGVATSRRMRVSPRGVFTGIATFGAGTIGELASAGSATRVETSSMGLLDWINTYGRDSD